jgi:two-component system response regulator PilR (NtrC family)
MHATSAVMDRSVARDPLEAFAIRAAASLVPQLTTADVDVLLCGERGVGKERLAREIHRRSARQAGRFAVGSCTARPVERLEAELFGVQRRGTLRRVRHRPGLLHEAADGTIYLDEIEALPRSTQARLIQALEEREFVPLGTARRTPLCARLITSTTVDPAGLVTAGTLRADLYDRLRAVTIVVPPLRKRRDEIPDLVDALLARYVAHYGATQVEIRDDTMQRLVHHRWSGNIPELENVVERIALTQSDAWVAAELDRASRAGPADGCVA